jgi:hypothetical protein
MQRGWCFGIVVLMIVLTACGSKSSTSGAVLSNSISFSGEITGAFVVDLNSSTCTHLSQPAFLGMTLKGMVNSTVYTLNFGPEVTYAGPGSYGGKVIASLGGPIPGGGGLGRWGAKAFDPKSVLVIAANEDSGTISFDVYRQGGGMIHIAGDWQLQHSCPKS